MSLLEFKPVDGGTMAAYENGERRGLCTFELDGCNAAIISLSCEQGRDDIAEGLLRSTLNYAANRMCYIAEYRETSYEEIALSLGFKPENGRLTAEIPDLLTGHCGGA